MPGSGGWFGSWFGPLEVGFSLGQTGSSPVGLDLLTTVYAADENIAIRASGDFPVLCPEWQKLAYGTDGVFATGDRWTLTSTSVDFLAAGVQAQHVVQLLGPKTSYKGTGDLLAVDTVSTGAVSLRRLGKPTGVGSPPGPAAGLTGITFLIATLDPQTEEASFDLNRRFNIDPAQPGRSPADVNDLRDLRMATVLKVLADRYAAENRTKEGDFGMKAGLSRQLLSEQLDRLTVRWKADANGIVQSTTMFGMRLVR